MTNSIINTSNNLAFLSQDNTPLTTSKILADALNYEHYKVLQLIRTHKKDLENFGAVQFQTLENHFTSEVYNIENKENFVKTGRKTVIAVLNEEQTTLLITFMKNLKKVVNIKIKLVQSFRDLKRQVQEMQNELIKQKETAQKLEFNKALTEAYELGQKHGYDMRGSSVMNAGEFGDLINVTEFFHDRRPECRRQMGVIDEIMYKLAKIKEEFNLLATGYMVTHDRVLDKLHAIKKAKTKQ